MGQHDPIRLALHANPGSAHAGANPAHIAGSHHSDVEPTAAAHLACNVADDFAGSWEAAWIDFGGEG